MDEFEVDQRPDWEYMSAKTLSEDVTLLDNVYEIGYGFNELHLACLAGSIERVVQAIRHSEDIESLTPNEERPLHLACHSGSLNIVRFLLKLGAKVNAADKNGQTPLFKITGPDSAELVAELLSYGAHTKTLRTLLHWACLQQNHVKIKMLLKIGLDPNTQTMQGASPLHISCAFGDIGIIKCLIEYGADVGAFDSTWLNPAFVAVYNNHLETLQLLVHHGANIQQTDITPVLHIATLNSNLSMVEYLLTAGVNPSSPDKNGVTALHYACTLFLPDIAFRLLEFGANPNALDRNRFSPLVFMLRNECPSNELTYYWHDICSSNFLQILNALLEYDLLIGPSAYVYTTEFLHNGTDDSAYSRSMLLDHVPSEDDDDDDEVFPWSYDLDLANDNGHLAAVQCLLKAGLKFEQNELFMDDEWIADGVHYDTETARRLMEWLRWRFLAGVTLPNADLLSLITQNILATCEAFLESDRGPVLTSNVEDETYMEELVKDVKKTRCDTYWLLKQLQTPRTLYFLCCTRVREHLSIARRNCNIFPLVNQLEVPQTIKDSLKLRYLPPAIERYPTVDTSV